MKKSFISFFVLISSFFATSQSLRLTGAVQYVDIGDLDISGNLITVEAKILLAYPVGNIVSKHIDPSNVNYLLRPTRFEITTENGFYIMPNPYNLDLNKWYHVAGTYDGQYIRYYVNGCLVIENPASGNLVQNNLNTGIGNRTFLFQNQEQFFGLIDEVRIWNVCRNEQEIKNNMNNLANPTSQIGLKAYYKFSNNLLNQAANNNHGTPIGSIQYGQDSLPVETFSFNNYTILSNNCNNYSVQISTNESNISYSLNGVNFINLTNNIITLPPGNNVVYFRNQAGCIISTNINLPPIQIITPTFTQVAPICSGATLSSLPTTSNNGITGTWSPALNNTATTTYTFTPDAGQCATTETMTITVNPLPLSPTGNASQSFCAIDNPTVSDLVVSGSNILWYQSASGGSPLSLNFDLIDDMILYASSIDVVTNCENPTRFPVTIQVENPALPSISSEQVFCLENNLTLGDSDTNGTTINWYDSAVGGNLVPLTQILNNGDVYYGASVSSISGCESTARIPLEITIIDTNLSFFNLITIDDNDLNKELIIQGIEQFPNNAIEIYNRYGNLVWSGINYDNVTNTFKGMASVSGVVSQGSYLPTGTYFFILSYPNDCEKSELKGFIQIDNKR